MLGHYLYNALYTLLCIFLSAAGLVRLTCANCIRCLSVKFDKYKPSSSRHLRKLPVHLGLVFVEDELFLSDVARIVAWSTIIGIKCVTVYDHKGRCKLREEELKSYIAKETSQLTKSSRMKIWSVFKKPNGFQKEIPLVDDKLHVIGPDDGQQIIVQVARKICNDVKNNQMSHSDIDIQFVDNLMQDKEGFPDPDLVFRFGNVHSMLGYLPWQLRLTEIFSMTTHRNLPFSEFYRRLDVFADVKQRRGV